LRYLLGEKGDALAIRLKALSARSQEGIDERLRHWNYRKAQSRRPEKDILEVACQRYSMLYENI
jgi:hypothetical protein